MHSENLKLYEYYIYNFLTRPIAQRILYDLKYRN